MVAAATLEGEGKAHENIIRASSRVHAVDGPACDVLMKASQSPAAVALTPLV